MPLLVFLTWLIPVGLSIRWIRYWRKVGEARQSHKLRRLISFGVSGAIYACMEVQVWLLARMGMAGAATVLPLHLCSFTGVIAPLMLLTGSQGLLEFVLFLGVPGAVLALLFPAILPSPWPIAMGWAFLSLHSLIVLAPFLRLAEGARPKRGAAGRVFLGGNLLLLLAAGVNAWLGTNYLFLRFPPTGTPLAALKALGNPAFVASLEMGALLILKAEEILYLKVAFKN